MAEGTYSPQKLKQALEAYGLCSDTFQLLRKGLYGEVYRTTIGDTDYVVKIRSLEAKSKDVTFTGLWTQEIVKEVPVPVSLSPIKDVPKIRDQCVEVSPYIKHENIEGKFMGPDAWTKVGEWVGRMHRLGQPIIDQAPVDLDYGNHPNQRLFNRYLQQVRIGARQEHLDVMKRVDNLVERSETLLQSHTLPTGVVHGDMHFWNVLYDRGNPIAIIDFDFLQRGILLYDLAYANIWLSCWEEERGWQKEGGEEWIGIAERYFTAYGEGRNQPLTESERACLWWAQIQIHLLFFFDQVRYSWNRLSRAMENLENAEKVFHQLEK